jgi:hypothetical protein
LKFELFLPKIRIADCVSLRSPPGEGGRKPGGLGERIPSALTICFYPRHFADFFAREKGSINEIDYF